MCIENVVVCMIGSASVFHCEVSEPPTARKTGHRGLSTRSSTRNGTAGSRPSRRSAVSPSMMAASAFGPSRRPVAEQLEPGRHRPADDRGAHDQPVAADQALPQPPRVVRLGVLGRAAWKSELV